MKVTLDSSLIPDLIALVSGTIDADGMTSLRKDVYGRGLDCQPGVWYGDEGNGSFQKDTKPDSRYAVKKGVRMAPGSSAKSEDVQE